jgi:hypothetical protein
VQSTPQVIPDGFDVTLPLPAPVAMTVSVWRAVNCAATFVEVVTVTTHAPRPVQPAPVQPAKTELLSGVAVSVTMSL